MAIFWEQNYNIFENLYIFCEVQFNIVQFGKSGIYTQFG